MIAAMAAQKAVGVSLVAVIARSPPWRDDEKIVVQDQPEGG
jgi:hypothetical protein